MTDLTVIPNIKIDAREHDIVISNEQALIILCRQCGNIRTISLHENPTEDQMAPEGRLSTGIVQHLGFSSCQCNAPNHGGVLRDVKAAWKRLNDCWILGLCMQIERRGSNESVVHAKYIASILVSSCRWVFSLCGLVFLDLELLWISCLYIAPLLIACLRILTDRCFISGVARVEGSTQLQKMHCFAHLRICVLLSLSRLLRKLKLRCNTTYIRHD